MMFYDTQSYGLRSKHCHQTDLKRKKLSGTPGWACSKKAKAAVLEHQRLSVAHTSVNAGGIMANKPRYYQTAVHKNNTRDRLARSINPTVAEKMRAILEELKRKEQGHE